MILKTYGVENLVDWNAQINVGKARVTVHFSGGALTSFGVTPAEYSTADPMMQHIIENSDYYRSGRIKIVRQVQVEDDAATLARKARKAKRAMRKVAEDAEMDETDAPITGADAPGTVASADAPGTVAAKGTNKGGEISQNKPQELTKEAEDSEDEGYLTAEERAESERNQEENAIPEPITPGAQLPGDGGGLEAPLPPEGGDGGEEPDTVAEGLSQAGSLPSLEEVEVSCLQDAQDYLKERFGLSATSTRSYEKAQAAANERGVKFVGSKF